MRRDGVCVLASDRYVASYERDFGPEETGEIPKLQRKLIRRGPVCIGVHTRRGSVLGVYRRVSAPTGVSAAALQAGGHTPVLSHRRP